MYDAPLIDDDVFACLLQHSGTLKKLNLRRTSVTIDGLLQFVQARAELGQAALTSLDVMTSFTQAQIDAAVAVELRAAAKVELRHDSHYWDDRDSCSRLTIPSALCSGRGCACV
jgi:hypothetical protein